MKIAFPTEEDNGLESRVYNHFGSAPLFVIVDSDSGAFEPVVNHDQHHLHGRCQPLEAVGGRTVEAVVLGGIGAGALQKLNTAGIKTYRAVDGTISENLNLIKAGLLPILAMDHTCAGHGSEGGCVH
ncbi:MAG: NifB/NifX family molybdenum-iron cluster-binding protein [Pseudomonadota bacterium]